MRLTLTRTVVRILTIFLLTVVLGFALAPEGHAAVLEPMTCVQTAVQAFVTLMGAHGDTVRLPACAPTNWTTTFDSPFGIMLEGQPCTIGGSGRTDASGREIAIATSCPTQIVDAVAGDADLIRIPSPPCAHPCGYQVGMRHLSITSTGQRTGVQSAVISFNGTGNITEDGRRVRLEYIRVVGTTGNSNILFRTSEWGVASHVYIQTPANTRALLFYHIQGGSSYSRARVDQRLASTTLFGREDAFTIENSVATVSCSTPLNSTLTDSHSSGGRIVVRNNSLEGYSIQIHGIEQGWMRGPHYMEVFGNKMKPCATGQDATMVESRSGGVMQWNNVMSAAFSAGTPAAHLKTYRMLGQFTSYNEANGHTAVDENDSANPLVACTTTASANAANSSTVTCGNVSWTTNEHQGKLVHQPWPACRERWNLSCAATIDSNTSNTLTFRPNIFDVANRASGQFPGSGTLNLAAAGGDLIHIDGVVSTLDSPCRAGGTQFGPEGLISGITMTGSVARLTSAQPLSSLGISSGDHVSIEEAYFVETSDYNNKPYRGTYQVNVTGSTTFEYTPRRVPSGPAPAGGAFKKVLVNSSNQVSNCYEFLNFNASSGAIHFSTGIPAGGSSKFKDLRVSGVDPNPVVHNWVGTSTTSGQQTSPTSPFNGSVGVGVGTVARRPTTCTTGVFYWATDEGEWDSTNGATPDGRGYKCTSTNTWSLAYTPLAFPHPLTTGSVPPTTPTFNKTIVASAITPFGMTLTWNKATDNPAEQPLHSYEVRRSLAPNIDSVATAEANGTVALPYTANIGTAVLLGLQPNTQYYFNVIVRDPNGAKTAYTMMSATTAAGAADPTPPVPGGSGVITVTTPPTVNSATLGWTKATDNTTSQTALQYEVRRSLSDNMGTVATAEANGTIAKTYTADINIATMTGLQASTTYYFNVIVRDLAGNKAIYNTVSLTTTGDTVPPTPGSSGTITSSSVSQSGVSLSWAKATDAGTPQTLLQYEVRRSTTSPIDTVPNAEANGIVIKAYTANLSSFNVTGLNPSTTYLFNVIVKDGAGNKSIYTQKSVTTTAPDSVPPVTGGSGAINTSSIRTDSLTLSWTAGTDNVTAKALLQYEVRRSTSNNIDSVAAAEANGTIAKAYTANMTSAAIVGLSPNTTYYFNVIVKDQGGNKAAYRTKSGKTAVAPDAVAPKVTVVAPANLLTGNATLSANATDDIAVASVEFTYDAGPGYPPVSIGETFATSSLQKFFQMEWNTKIVGDGPLRLFAVARDAAGNAAESLPVAVRVSNGSLPVTTAANGAATAIASALDSPDVTNTYAELLGTGFAASATITYVKDSVLISAAGVPGTQEILAGSTYVEIGEGANTGIAMVNPSVKDAEVSFYFTDAAGVNVAQGTFMLPSRRQVVTFLNEAPFNGPDSLKGSFTFSSTAPLAAIAMKGFTNEREEFIFTTLPVIPAEAPAFEPVLPLFVNGGGWTTEVVLSNSTDYVQSGQLEFMGQGSGTDDAQPFEMQINGIFGRNFPYSISPHSIIRIDTSGMGEVQIGSVKVTPGGASPSAFAVISYRMEGITVSESTVTATPAGQAFRSYVEFTEGAYSGQSGLAVANTSTGVNTVTFSLTSLDGTLLATSTAVLPPGGQISRFVKELFPEVTGEFHGVVRLTSDSPVVVAGLRGAFNSRNEYLMSAMPAFDDSASVSGHLVFPHIVNGAGFTTQVVVVGQSGVERSGRLSFTAGDGVAIPMTTGN